jgi:hypothetical protein
VGAAAGGERDGDEPPRRLLPAHGRRRCWIIIHAWNCPPLGLSCCWSKHRAEQIAAQRQPGRWRAFTPAKRAR